ncbi:hypothetical protein [Gallaecimonas pentaromativorans]|uniref:Uncharacterized protein n=1 Tax=Gallaecimonas pentaromativorans TaxID=584787 RepID=A0A3N1PYK5_9GAMM|nr:hypothetical protein [Gallaecimonas pentaromativorans]MED5525081.1 hypothetical protein [Pseudomonadota bacterium]ROQ29646.1 hypothetical protein EDC28_10210 [Gallaecimonas pentaromativorans]
MSTQDNPFDQEELLEIVENQLADNEPVKVKETLLRLTMKGMAREEAVEYIACALSLEIIDVVENGQPFNHKRYAAHLDTLPEMPWLEE